MSSLVGWRQVRKGHRFSYVGSIAVPCFQGRLLQACSKAQALVHLPTSPLRQVSDRVTWVQGQLLKQGCRRCCSMEAWKLVVFIQLGHQTSGAVPLGSTRAAQAIHARPCSWDAACAVLCVAAGAVPELLLQHPRIFEYKVRTAVVTEIGSYRSCWLYWLAVGSDKQPAREPGGFSTCLQSAYQHSCRVVPCGNMQLAA